MGAAERAGFASARHNPLVLGQASYIIATSAPDPYHRESSRRSPRPALLLYSATTAYARPRPLSSPNAVGTKWDIVVGFNHHIGIETRANPEGYGVRPIITLGTHATVSNLSHDKFWVFLFRVL